MRNSDELLKDESILQNIIMFGWRLKEVYHIVGKV